MLLNIAPTPIYSPAVDCVWLEIDNEHPSDFNQIRIQPKTQPCKCIHIDRASQHSMAQDFVFCKYQLHTECSILRRTSSIPINIRWNYKAHTYDANTKLSPPYKLLNVQGMKTRVNVTWIPYSHTGRSVALFTIRMCILCILLNNFFIIHQ